MRYANCGSWSAFLPNPPAFGREPFYFKIKSLGPTANDDLYTMNTQSGSQVRIFTGMYGLTLIVAVGWFQTCTTLLRRASISARLTLKQVGIQHGDKVLFYNNVR